MTRDSLCLGVGAFRTSRKRGDDPNGRISVKMSESLVADPKDKVEEIRERWDGRNEVMVWDGLVPIHQPSRRRA
jgi:hypothetical protein